MMDRRISSWVLGDFGRHFPQGDLWDRSLDWEFRAENQKIIAVHFYSGLLLSFDGDGVIIAEIKDRHECFDDHAYIGDFDGCFVRWFNKKFPELSTYMIF